MARVLSTKLLTDYQKAFFHDANIALVDIGFIETIPNYGALSGAFKNGIVTSQNAASYIMTKGISIEHLFCVGPKTADLLAQKYRIKEVCNSSVELSEILVNRYSSESFTFFSGNISLNEIPLALKANKIDYTQIEVYKTVLKPQSVEGVFDAILFFSPSGVHSFLERNTTGYATCICIGETTASTLKGKAKTVVTAPEVSVESTILTTITLLNHD